MRLGYQWNTEQRAAQRTEIRLRYSPASQKIASFAYRYDQDLLEEIDVAAAWPVAKRWNVVGRYNYSMQDRKLLEGLVGLEYATCCWSVRTSWRRYLTDRTGQADTSFTIQLMLKGLGNSDSAADRLLERGILEYD
jgi:LPS-assembly protein